MLLPLAVIATFAVLFVGWEVIEARLLPERSIGLRHALLTLRAVVVTGVASTVVYFMMRRQQRRLSSTAERIAHLLEAYDASAESTVRFDNPHLVHCRDVLECHRTSCPMYHGSGKRCWQVVSLGHVHRGDGAKAIDIHHCHECAVFKQSCPDELTQLGESFNSLMYLLELEAEQLGRIRGQLVEREKMVAIGQMAAGFAHEVGNPLSSISSIVQIIKRGGAKPPNGEQLDLILDNIGRISNTVRQMSRLSRPAPERWEHCDIGETLREAVELVSYDRRARKVRIEFDPDLTLPKTYVLRGQLQQVFINLALNAFDAMKDGGALAIGAEWDGVRIRVRIKDNGCGIPPATNRRVFEPFFTTKEPGQGTGLGLSVSYGIVQKHGGHIEFDSKVGEGTTFTVDIPILRDAPEP